MKRLFPIAVLALCAGCFSSAPPPPVYWTIDADVDLAVSAVEVVSPFDGAKLTVMRPDGSFAFDSFNAFAARPSALIRAMVRTDAKSPSLLIRKLALDCRKSGERFALVELELRKGANAPVRASAAVPTDDGNYTRAFSTAFVQAVGRLTAETKR